jgi:DNA invertase Pin-like site-specific DNA recombinase
MFQILGLFAEFEVAIIRERERAGVDRARRTAHLFRGAANSTQKSFP